MFTNDKWQAERTGRFGTPGTQCLQELVKEFQKTTNQVQCWIFPHCRSYIFSVHESKERIDTNLANFAYDLYKHAFLSQLNVLELFLDCMAEPIEKLVEFGTGGICNSSVDPENAAMIIQCGGIPLVVECLTSPVTNPVTYALGTLYYLCNHSSRKEILKPEVVEDIRKYAGVQQFGKCIF